LRRGKVKGGVHSLPCAKGKVEGGVHSCLARGKVKSGGRGRPPHTAGKITSIVKWKTSSTAILPLATGNLSTVFSDRYANATWAQTCFELALEVKR
jgi:hypothetical protein